MRKTQRLCLFLDALPMDDGEELAAAILRRLIQNPDILQRLRAAGAAAPALRLVTEAAGEADAAAPLAGRARPRPTVQCESTGRPA